MPRAVHFRNLSQTTIRKGAAVITTGTVQEPTGTRAVGAESNEEASESFLGITEEAVNRDSLGVAVRESGQNVLALVADETLSVGDMLQTTTDGRLQLGTLHGVAQAFENKTQGDGKERILVMLQ